MYECHAILENKSFNAIQFHISLKEVISEMWPDTLSL